MIVAMEIFKYRADNKGGYPRKKSKKKLKKWKKEVLKFLLNPDPEASAPGFIPYTSSFKENGEKIQGKISELRTVFKVYLGKVNELMPLVDPLVVEGIVTIPVEITNVQYISEKEVRLVKSYCRATPPPPSPPFSTRFFTHTLLPPRPTPICSTRSRTLISIPTKANLQGLQERLRRQREYHKKGPTC